jgi:hypothetical protein
VKTLFLPPPSPPLATFNQNWDGEEDGGDGGFDFTEFVDRVDAGTHAGEGDDLGWGLGSWVGVGVGL